MPEPGQTPQPAFERGDELAYGEATDANRLAESLDESLADEFDFDEEEEFGQPGGTEEEFLFGGTDRPGEPISAGAPFGPGADASPFAYESDAAFVERIAAQLQNDRDPRVRGFAKRLLEGE